MRRDEGVLGLARVLGHETNVRLIEALSAGEATVSDLACGLALEQPRVSTHLAQLRAAGLVACRATGRQRVYALRGEAPALALATLRTLADSVAGAGSPPSQAAARAVRDDLPIRRARTCYDHLAGVAGVQLLDGLLERGWLEAAGGRELVLTDAGAAGMRRAGVAVPAGGSRRAFAIECLDWTERRPHLGGAL